MANKSPIELDVYGVTLGFRLGDNPNLDVRIPLSAAHFDVEESMIPDSWEELKFSLTIGSINILPGTPIRSQHFHSDFPIFDESMTNVNFETMAESSTAYGMNWSGRLSISRYFPSNDVNDDAFWLLRGGLGLHYHLHDNFTMLPFSATTTPLKAELRNRSVLDQSWMEFGAEFLFMPNRPWNFSFGIAGIGHHKIIEEYGVLLQHEGQFLILINLKESIP